MNLNKEHPCPFCPDFGQAMTAHSIKLDIQDPKSGERNTDFDHKGPTIITTPGHIMIVYRGHKEPVVVKGGQILSLCDGDVVRILEDPDGGPEALDKQHP